MRLFLAITALIALGVLTIFGITALGPKTAPENVNVGRIITPLARPTVVFGTPARLVPGSSQVPGSNNIALTIVEFGDFRCAACALTEEPLAKVLADYPGQVRLAWKDFPNEGAHPGATDAATAARCAADQDRFWEFHDLLLSRQNDSRYVEMAAELGLDADAFSGCLERKDTRPAVQRDLEEGLRLSVDAAPYFFIGARRVSGALTESQFRAIIDAELATAK